MVRVPCYSDFTSLKKGSWSREEDQKLKAYIKRYGIWNWTEMPKAAGLLRSGKSCRLRWVNYLKPGIKRGNFSREEEEIILKLHEKMGNRWSTIAARLPGRTDNEIKNFWHTRLSKLKDNPPKSLPRKTPNLEAKLIGSPKETGFLGDDLPRSPQLSIDFSSSSTTSFAVGAEKNIHLEGIYENTLSTQPYSSDSSSSVTSSAVGTDKSEMTEGSMESASTFGDFQAFPMEDFFMMGDYFWETCSDLGVGFPICEDWIQEPLWA